MTMPRKPLRQKKVVFFSVLYVLNVSSPFLDIFTEKNLSLKTVTIADRL
nr:MAG TPA: hypothetical protein [Caudoviricetes sp.]